MPITTSAFHHYVVLGLHHPFGLLMIQVPTELIQNVVASQNHSSEWPPVPEQPSLQTPAPLPSTVTVVQASALCGLSGTTIFFPSLGSTTSFFPKIKQFSPFVHAMQRASLHTFSRPEGDHPSSKWATWIASTALVSKWCYTYAWGYMLDHLGVCK